LWRCEPFTRGQAWVDLLLLANFEHSFFFKRGVKIEVDRGQVARSEVELADRWKWSRTKLRKFLNDLEKEQQIEQHKSNVSQLLTIVNYDSYQEKRTADDTAERQQKNTLKEEEEFKEVDRGKKPPRKTPSFSPPTLQEVKIYFQENGFSETLAERFYNGYQVADWKDSKGNKINNWKQKCIHVWFKDESRTQTKPQPTSQNVISGW
jgi:hypothetical protein